MIYRSRVDPRRGQHRAAVCAREAAAECHLWYGYGKDPYCNFRDAEDLAVPVFELKIAAH